MFPAQIEIHTNSYNRLWLSMAQQEPVNCVYGISEHGNQTLDWRMQIFSQISHTPIFSTVIFVKRCSLSLRVYGITLANLKQWPLVVMCHFF